MRARILFIIIVTIFASETVSAQDQGPILPWGIDGGTSNDKGQVTNTPDGTDYIAIDSGFYHSIALQSDGRILAWGGDKDSSYPARTTNQVKDTPTSNDFIAIAAGEYHSLAVFDCQLQGDFNDDCRVNLSDFRILTSVWLMEPGYDLSHLQSMTANWLIDCRQTPSDLACIPE